MMVIRKILLGRHHVIRPCELDGVASQTDQKVIRSGSAFRRTDDGCLKMAVQFRAQHQSGDRSVELAVEGQACLHDGIISRK